MRDTPAMLRELNVVEQRYQAVLEVLDGTPVTEVAQRFGVARQTVHRWVARYRESGLDGLADRSHAPQLGSAPPGLRAGAPRSPGRLPVHCLPGAGPVPPDRAGLPAQAPRPVPPLGTLGGDGAVADGRDREPVPG